jgi:hypothetical protein
MFHRLKPIIAAAILSSLIFGAELSYAQTSPELATKNEDRVQPWVENPRYWQYEGCPILLLGGSKTDHLFLADGLLEHLEEMKEIGANYVRNTMSQREGKELKAHLLLPDGRFDMDRWKWTERKGEGMYSGCQGSRETLEAMGCRTTHGTAFRKTAQ